MAITVTGRVVSARMTRRVTSWTARASTGVCWGFSRHFAKPVRDKIHCHKKILQELKIKGLHIIRNEL